MITDKYIDGIQSVVAPGGVITDDNRHDRGYLLSVLNSYRNFVVQDLYRKERRVIPNIYQKFVLKKDAFLEDGCFSYFYCPEVLQVGTDKYGFNFVGSSDGEEQYQITLDQSTYASNKKNRILRSHFGNAGILYDPVQGTMRLNNPAVEMIMVSAALTEPTLQPGFNYTKDNYPIDMGTFDVIRDMLMRGYVRTVIPMRMDRASNTAEDVQVNPNTGR